MTYQLARRRHDEMVEQAQCHVADGACGHHTYKFQSCQDERIWEVTLEGPDEEIGSVDELGWYGLLIFDEAERNLFGDAAAIVESTNSGAVYVLRYETIDEADEAWQSLENEYAEYWEEVPYQ